MEAVRGETWLAFPFHWCMPWASVEFNNAFDLWGPELEISPRSLGGGVVLKHYHIFCHHCFHRYVTPN